MRKKVLTTIVTLCVIIFSSSTNAEDKTLTPSLEDLEKDCRPMIYVFYRLDLLVDESEPIPLTIPTHNQLLQQFARWIVRNESRLSESDSLYARWCYHKSIGNSNR